MLTTLLRASEFEPHLQFSVILRTWVDGEQYVDIYYCHFSIICSIPSLYFLCTGGGVYESKHKVNAIFYFISFLLINLESTKKENS